MTGHSPAIASSSIATARPLRVLTLADITIRACQDLLRPFGLTLALVPRGSEIPGSYWGESEAGLVGSTLYCRADTPVHSLLHEACHYICMDRRRRETLDRDAGGDYDEENAVCYLQILLAEYLTEVGAPRMAADMDAWGYTFRLGSARAWFEEDAADTCVWLKERDLIDNEGLVTWRVRVD
jgi:hypothetical protein